MLCFEYTTPPAHPHPHHSTPSQLVLLALLVKQEELDWVAATTMCRMLLERSDALRTAAADLVAAIAPSMGADHIHEVAAATAAKAPARAPSKGRHDVPPSGPTAELAAVVRVVAYMALERGATGQEMQGRARVLYTHADVEPLPAPMVQAVVDSLYDRCAHGWLACLALQRVCRGGVVDASHVLSYRSPIMHWLGALYCHVGEKKKTCCRCPRMSCTKAKQHPPKGMHTVSDIGCPCCATGRSWCSTCSRRTAR